jgi:hypothetical protein
MASRIIHFGADDCRRIAVLRIAGYSVDECRSVAELHVALVGIAATRAILFTENHGVTPQGAIALIRSITAAPLILFQTDKRHYDESQFDMVIPVLTEPQSWLNSIAELLVRSSQLTR